MGFDEDIYFAALFHDLLEDCPGWTPARMIKEGFSQKTVDIVKVLTKKPGENYFEYIDKIKASGRDAIRIKLADLVDNANLFRLPSFTKGDAVRFEKYHRAYLILIS